MHTTGESKDDRGAADGSAGFEALLAELSLRFANVGIDGIEAEVESALAQLVARLGYDRCTYGEFVPDGSFSVVRSVAAAGLEPLPRGPRASIEPWVIEQYEDAAA